MPAGRPRSIDDSKVFDVAKPGKTKPLGTSRPVVVNHSMAVKDATVVEPADENNESMLAPSVTRKIISPISAEEEKPEQSPRSSITIMSEPDEQPGASEAGQITIKTRVKPDTKAENDADKSDDKLAEPEPAALEEEGNEQPSEDESINQNSPEQPEKTEEENPAEASAEVKTEVAADTGSSQSAEEPKSAEVSSSESASVDALAEASERPKIDQKVAEEQAKKEAALQELIDSKKYVVPLSHDSSGRAGHKTIWFSLLFIVLLAAGAYIAIDAKVININIELPYHFFQQ